MTYIATLASCILGRLAPSYDFITSSGSSHGADQFFPPDLDSHRTHLYRPAKPTDHEWNQWYEKALRDYAKDGICIIKEGWQKYGIDRWEKRFDVLDCICIISSMDSKADLIYCWLNMIDKIPTHAHKRLIEKSRFYPKLWNTIPKHLKISEMINNMPLYDIDCGPMTLKPNFKTNALTVLDNDYPQKIQEFLDSQGFDTKIDESIIRFHKYFTDKQRENQKKALELSSGKKWKSRGPFDDVLFGWYDKSNSISTCHRDHLLTKAALI